MNETIHEYQMVRLPLDYVMDTHGVRMMGKEVREMVKKALMEKGHKDDDDLQSTMDLIATSCWYIPLPVVTDIIRKDFTPFTMGLHASSCLMRTADLSYHIDVR